MSWSGLLLCVHPPVFAIRLCATCTTVEVKLSEKEIALA